MAKESCVNPKATELRVQNASDKNCKCICNEKNICEFYSCIFTMIHDSMENLIEYNIDKVKTYRKPLEILEGEPFWYMENSDLVLCEN